MGPQILLVLISLAFSAQSVNVTYDSRSLIIDGERKLLVGGCIHYPRSTPQMWPSLLKTAKEGGVDLIETYVFWNAHERVKGQYDFSGNLDLIGYLKQVQAAGLYVHIRLGPYVCAEWNYGGFPEWLKEIPGIVFRTYNQPYLNEMKTWLDYVVNYLKANNMFAPQGGPIVLAQIENEYGNVELYYGNGGKQYVQWCGDYARALNLGIPWIMCQQSDAPFGIINTVNGFYGDNFEPNYIDSPKFWTENWPGWFQDWNEAVPRRPVEDIAYAVARFYAKGGSLAVYYMYHGGTNFGRSSGGPFIITSYDYDVAIDEYGLTHEPKYSHLKHLHTTLHNIASILLSYPEPEPVSLGQNLEIHIYGNVSNPASCVAFLSNNGVKDADNVQFNGQTYFVPAWSVSIMIECHQVLFNTAQVQIPPVLPHQGHKSHSPSPRVALQQSVADSKQSATTAIGATATATGAVDIPADSWSWWSEPRDGSWGTGIAGPKPYELINITHDTTDYLWYETNYTSSTTANVTLKVVDFYDYMNVFVNGIFFGAKRSPTGSWTISLKQGVNRISLSVQTIGLINYGTYFEAYTRGILGKVYIDSADITNQLWIHTVGLQGDQLKVWSPQGVSQVSWTNNTLSPTKAPWTWYKSVFSLTTETLNSGLPLTLDLTSLGKGYVWLNGYNLGRHFPAAIATSSNCDVCDYRGGYSDTQCRQGCGSPSQNWYHAPREYLSPTNNLLVVFEEGNGDVTGVKLIQRQIGVMCADNGVNAAQDLNANLLCGDGQVIASIDFASFGNPQGPCRQFTTGSCSASNSTTVVSNLCLGQSSCAIPVTTALFGDPCPGVSKRLKVQVTCK